MNTDNPKEEKEYKGLWFNPATPREVKDLLVKLNQEGKKNRIRIFYGDPTSGKDWGEELDVLGYVGRSTGPTKIPLLIYDNRCIGGGAILCNCIVKIMDTSGKTLYQHPTYEAPAYEVEGTTIRKNGELWAQCKTPEQALRLKAFLLGERMNH
jgi:hypothetical protein